MADIQKKISLLPKKLRHEYIAQVYIDFIANRYPTAEKMLKLSSHFGIQDSIEAQIVIFSEFRDLTKQISPLLFQSPEHREDTYMAILDGLEELEKILDEQELYSDIENQYNDL